MKRTKLFVLLVAAAACLMLAGCGPKLAEPPERPKHSALKIELPDGIYYFIGTTVPDRDFRLEVSQDPSKAVEVFKEEVEGGFKLYFMDGETKTYLDSRNEGNYYNIILSTENGCVFHMDEDTGAMVTHINDIDCFLGTNRKGGKPDGKIYVCIQAGKMIFITGDNAKNVGKTNWIAEYIE